MDREERAADGSKRPDVYSGAEIGKAAAHQA